MDIHNQLLTENDCYKEGRYIKPSGIMVHSTGANNPKLSRYLPGDDLIGYNVNGNHWNQGGLDVCVHAFIGKDLNGNIQIYETLPWTMRGWHCGGSGNSTHISFEICEDGLTDSSYFDSAYDAAVFLSAFLCRKFNIPAEKVICHSEGAALGIASSHADVMHWFPKFGKTMDTFRDAVKAEITSQSNALTEEDDNMVRYKFLSDIPNDYGFRDIINTLMNAGILKGDGSDPYGNGDVIDLSEDQVRTLIMIYRGGAFDRKLSAMGMTPAVQ